MAQTAHAYAPRVERTPTSAARRPQAKVRIRPRAAHVRTGAFVAAAVIGLLAYVGVTAELTAQTYRLNDDRAREAQLVQTNNDLRQQVAGLESLGRLEAAAAKLHMTYPKTVSVLSLPGAIRPQPANTAFAFVARLLHVKE